MKFHLSHMNTKLLCGVQSCKSGELFLQIYVMEAYKLNIKFMVNYIARMLLILLVS